MHFFVLDAPFNVRTPIRIAEQGCLVHKLEVLAVGVCCIRDTRTQDPISVIRLKSPSSRSAKFHLHHSGDPENAASDVAGIGVGLSESAAAALLDWILVDSRQCAARL